MPTDELTGTYLFRITGEAIEVLTGDGEVENTLTAGQARRIGEQFLEAARALEAIQDFLA